MTCQHCIHRDKDGHCRNPKLTEWIKGDDNLACFEVAYPWVGPNFGCIHFEPKLKVGQVIKDTRHGIVKKIIQISDQGFLLRNHDGTGPAILYNSASIATHWKPIDPQ